jgi:gliding motility-associated-like protein
MYVNLPSGYLLLIIYLFSFLLFLSPVKSQEISVNAGNCHITISNVFFTSPQQCGGTGIIKIAVLNGINGERFSIDYDSNSTVDNTGTLSNDTIVISGLSAGTAISNLTITSLTSGCSATGSFPGTIMDPATWSIGSVHIADPVRCGDFGSMQIQLSGATVGHTFNIDFNNDADTDRTVVNNSGTLAINDLAAGTIISNLTVTDATSKCLEASLQNRTILNPAAPTVNLDAFNSLCLNSPSQALSVGTPSGGTYAIDGNSAAAINPVTLGVGNHTVIYSYTGTNNCSNSDTASLVINSLPDATILGEQTLCPQSQQVIYTTGYSNAYRYRWTVNGGTYTEGNSGAIITVNWSANSTGSVQLTTLNTINQCSDSSSLAVSFSDAEMPVISQCVNEYHVKASMDGNLPYYVFTTADTVCIPKAADRCTTPLNISFSADNSTTHNVSQFVGFRLNKGDQNSIHWTLSDATGNTAECTVNIVFEVEKTAPTAFSPNGDLHNDTWEIDFLANYPDCVVKVYNRWGMLLFESAKGYPVPWDGRSNGRLVPVDTYYFIITSSGNEKVIKGYVSVVY